MIYFAQIGHDGPIKIGDCEPTRVRARLMQLQTGVPWKLRLLRTEDGQSSELYHHFMESRMRGEWFYPTKELMAYIAKPHELRDVSPKSWQDARRRHGSHLIFLRGILDFCRSPDGKFDWTGWRVVQ